MVEALWEDDGCLEYKLMGVEDAYIDQRTLAAEKAKEVEEVKAALQEKEGTLTTAHGERRAAEGTRRPVQGIDLAGAEGYSPCQGADPTPAGPHDPRGGVVLADQS
jgi:hypothetical protein